MRNIYFKGNYVSDEQLIKRESIPDNATEFGIVSDLRSEMVRGFLMMLPLIVVMILLTYFKIKTVDYHLTMNIHLIAAFFALIISGKILTLAHEVIHACFYPADRVKEIWKSNEQGAYFVYCEEAIDRNRFILLCLAPMFILGIIPFIIWLLIPHVIPMPYDVATAILFWMMTVMSIGDVANVYHVLKDVPKGKMVFNHGLLRSFYIDRTE